MSTTMQDAIEREIVVCAPRERVYQAITDPEQIVRWFPDAVEGNLHPGSDALFTFEGYGGSQIYVEAADPHHYFAYRWLPGGDYEVGFRGDVRQKPHTLVEFRLEEHPEGTRVLLKESGFAGLPAEFYAGCMKDNNQGWDYMLDRLVKLFAPA